MDLDFAEPEVRPKISFFVEGTPSPGGSKRFVGMSKRTGRAILIDMGGKRTKNWRAAVALTAQSLGIVPFAKGIPLELTCKFIMPRPKCHYHTSKAKLGKLREDAPDWHVNAPDTTKLTRSTEDALKGLTWHDDSQVALQHGSKRYGAPTGALIEISPL